MLTLYRVPLPVGAARGGRGRDQFHTLPRIVGCIGVGHILVGALQPRQQWVEGWCCQVALVFLVQRQQGICMNCHILLQEMISLSQQRH